jgi:hypothetical protein
MHDLDIQIRDYIDATSDPLTIDDILYAPIGAELVRPLRQRRPRFRWNRGWGIAAAAFVLITVGLLPLLFSGESDQPAGTTIPVSTTVANIPLDARPAVWVAYGIHDANIETYDVWITDPSGRTQSLAATPEDGIWRMCPQFSPSGDYLARVETAEVGDEGVPSQDWVLVVSDFDSTSGELTNERRFPTRSGEPDCGAWSTIDDVYAYPSPEGSLMLLDATTDNIINLGDPIGTHLAWSPNGTEIGSSNGNAGVLVRSLTGGTDRSFLGRSDYDYSWLGGPQ